MCPWRPAALLAALALSSVGASAHAQAAPDPRYAQLPELEWFAVNTNERVRARLYRADGTVDSDAVARLSHLLRDTQRNVDCPAVPRSLQLLVRVATHFGAQRIEVISAYRTGRRADGSREGYHGIGSAIDFRLPGVEPGLVAAYARSLAHVGVGSYPHQGFVHLDSREQSFFWENANDRGRRRRGWDRPVERGDVATRDQSWCSANDAPWDPPGVALALDPTPPTQAGARSPHGRRHGRRGPRRHHRELHVFRGAG